MEKLILGICLWVSVFGGGAASGAILDQRVVSLSPSITELIYLLGAQDQLVADTIYCNVPPEAGEKLRVGTMTQANVEKIVYLRPDLVIASPLSSKKQMRILKAQGIRVMLKENPKSFEQMCRLTLDMGNIMGARDRAEAIVTRARKDVERVVAATQPLAKKQVFIQIGLKPLKTVTGDIFINEFIKLGGGINITEHESSGVYSREKVVRSDPDVILIATMGSAKKAREEERQRWMEFSSLKAAAQNHIYVLNPDVICSPTPASFARGLSIIADLIHPEEVHEQ